MARPDTTDFPGLHNVLLRKMADETRGSVGRCHATTFTRSKILAVVKVHRTDRDSPKHKVKRGIMVSRSGLQDLKNLMRVLIRDVRVSLLCRVESVVSRYSIRMWQYLAVRNSTAVGVI
ncbi:hypothetical protein ACLOJK_001900 [Asimina triloba]